MRTFLSICLWGFCISAFAQMHTYDYKQEIKGAEAGTWKSLALPESVYAKLKSQGNDIRIYGITPEKDTVEVPYILDKKQLKTTELPLEFQLINQSKTDQGTYFTLKNHQKQFINQIHLNFENQNFDLKITLQASNDQKQWFTLLKDYRIAAIENESVSFVYNTLKFTDSEYLYYRIFIPDPAHQMKFVAATVSHNTKTPVVLHQYTTQVTVTQNKKYKESWVRVQLPKLLPVSMMQVSPAETHDYFRPIYIGYEDSIQTARGWQKRFVQIDSDVLSSQSENAYDLSPRMLSNLVFRIANQDNLPLEIKQVDVYGAYYQLTARFPQKQATYFLVYGKARDYRPDYDIFHFPKNIPTDASILTLAEATPLAAAQNKDTILGSTNKNWLWGVVVLMVALLFYFSLKMLREKNKNESLF